MTRFALLTLVGLLAAAPMQAAESEDSLADRLRALRKGWSFASDRPTPPTASPAARQRPAASSQTAAGRPAPGSDAGRLPRVDPREVLPRRWFGEGVAAPKSPRPSGSSEATVSDHTVVEGSSRSRLLRDLREQTGTGAAPRVAGRSLLGVPTRRPLVMTTDANKPSKSPRTASVFARAGSVLSSDPAVTPSDPATLPSSTASGPATSSASAALARAIAADVAQSMAEDDASAPVAPGDQLSDVAGAAAGGPEADVMSESAASDVADSDVAADVDAPLIAAEPKKELRIALNTTAPAGPKPSVSVSSAKAAPLFLGDRYEPAETETKVAATRRDVFDAPAAEAAATDDDRWLLDQAAPMLLSRVQGPRTIVVGREAKYRVVLANRGDMAAEQVVTRVTVPAGAELMGATSKRGRVTRSAEADDSQVLLWSLDRLATQEPVSLELRLIARTGQPIDLGVACEHRPVDGAATVQVQEPKLDLQLAGPAEVLYGKAQVYRLTISNPGTGTAEDVVLRLTPPGSNARTTTRDLGSLAAGASRTIEVELIAREPGKLAIAAAATAEGGVSADTERPILCRKAELVVDWRGPDERYAGAPALYYFRVRNPGTAVAPGVALSVDLPEGFRVLNAGDGNTIVGRQLTYSVGSLKAGDDRYFELRGVFERAGANELVLNAAGSDTTRSEQVVAETEVVALADLKLDIADPKGPIATGQEIEYEIRVTNRGANAAHDVRVLGLFSEGIEPMSASGGMSDIQDGRVAFDTISLLPAGAEQRFTIRARADDEGTHLFRAEVLCRDLEIKLAAEEATRFFRDETLDVAVDGRGPYYPR